MPEFMSFDVIFRSFQRRFLIGQLHVFHGENKFLTSKTMVFSVDGV